MPTPFTLQRPHSLEMGAPYLLRESTAYTPRPDRLAGILYAPVTFVGYDSCPAFVYVRDQDGYVGRCPREDLFQQQASGR